jgi:hypothetical protein
MIGRLYLWRGDVWLLVCRGEPFDRGPRRNVLLQRVRLWCGVGWGGQWRESIDGQWYRPDGGERVVRPFRGLRRAPEQQP